MPRNSRVVAIGYPHHITQLGNNREPVFFDDDREKGTVYLSTPLSILSPFSVSDITAY
jgi:REP element-mobilizing transposase RayT